MNKRQTIIAALRKALDAYVNDGGRSKADQEQDTFTLTREQLNEICDCLEEAEPPRPIPAW